MLVNQLFHNRISLLFYLVVISFEKAHVIQQKKVLSMQLPQALHFLVVSTNFLQESWYRKRNHLALLSLCLINEGKLQNILTYKLHTPHILIEGILQPCLQLAHSKHCCLFPQLHLNIRVQIYYQELEDLTFYIWINQIHKFLHTSPCLSLHLLFSILACSSRRNGADQFHKKLQLPFNHPYLPNDFSNCKLANNIFDKNHEILLLFLLLVCIFLLLLPETYLSNLASMRLA